MHPAPIELKQYVEGSLPVSERPRVHQHLAKCELCREAVDNYRQLLEAERIAENEPLPSRASSVIDHLFAAASTRENVINLRLLPVDRPKTGWRIAADGPEQPPLQLENLATFFSDQPELVLRVMRNRNENRDYLQLVADSPSQVAHQMVRLPELGLEFVTDANGEAGLQGVDLQQVQALKWQIKMPDAVFALESLDYDPDRTEYEKQFTLETEQNDRIRVTFEGKTEGRLLRIEILELGGRTEWDNVRVSVNQASRSDIKSTSANRPVTFTLTDPATGIDIRLFE